MLCEQTPDTLPIQYLLFPNPDIILSQIILDKYNIQIFVITLNTQLVV